VAIFTWIMGGLYDKAGPRMALRYMAILPLILILIFTGIWLYDRARGGYKVVKLAAEEQSESSAKVG
jgi:hypothetical protein